MKTNRLALLAAVGVVVPASAFTIYSAGDFAGQKGRDAAAKTESVSPVSISAARQAAKTSGRASNMIVKVADGQTRSENPYAQYG